MFEASLKALGVSTDGFELKEGPFGTGGFSTKPLKAGDVIASIPYSLCLSEATLWSGEGFAQFGRVIWKVLQARDAAPDAKPLSGSELRGEILGPDGQPVKLHDSRYSMYLYSIAARAGKNCCGCRCGTPELVELGTGCRCCASCNVDYGCGQGIDSRWTPYFRNIPVHHDLTLEWTKTERKWIHATNLFFASVERLTHLYEWLTEITVLLGTELVTSEASLDISPTLFTLERMLWAHCAYASRTFPYYLSVPPSVTISSTSSDAVSSTGPLVTTSVPSVQRKSLHACYLPWLDMLNHYPNTPITWRQGVLGVEFVTERDYDAGAELYNNYGPKSNEELILNYGFYLEDNPQDYAWVSVAVRQGDPLLIHRSAVIALAGLNIPDDGSEGTMQQLAGVDGSSEAPGIRFYLRHGQPLPPRLLAVFRVCLMSHAELDYLFSTYSELGFTGELKCQSTSGELLDVLTAPIDYTGGPIFPFVATHFAALTTLSQLLSVKHKIAKEAYENILDEATNAENDAVVTSHRYKCARVYVSSQVNIFKDALDQVNRMLEHRRIAQCVPSLDGSLTTPVTLLHTDFREPLANVVTIARDTSTLSNLHAWCSVTQEFVSGSVVFTVPAPAVLSRNTIAQSTPELADVLDTVVDGLEDEYCIALMLLYHRSSGERSKFHPFIQHLEAVFPPTLADAVLSGFGKKKGKKSKRSKTTGASDGETATTATATPKHVTIPLLSTPDELKFERHSEMAVVYHETIDEVITVCDEVIPALLEAYDELFKPSAFTKSLFLWATAVTLHLAAVTDGDVSPGLVLLPTSVRCQAYGSDTVSSVAGTVRLNLGNDAHVSSVSIVTATHAKPGDYLYLSYGRQYKPDELCVRHGAPNTFQPNPYLQPHMFLLILPPERDTFPPDIVLALDILGVDSAGISMYAGQPCRVQANHVLRIISAPATQVTAVLTKLQECVATSTPVNTAVDWNTISSTTAVIDMLKCCSVRLPHRSKPVSVTTVLATPPVSNVSNATIDDSVMTIVQQVLYRLFPELLG